VGELWTVRVVSRQRKLEDVVGAGKVESKIDRLR